MSRKPQRPDVPAAVRTTPGAWRDPRLWVGVALVAGSVVAGSAVVGSADDTTAVWAASRDLAAGEVIEAKDLVSTRIRFVETDTATGYLPVAAALPEELTLTQAVGAGQLVPRGGLGSDDATDSVAVSVAVDPEHVPVDVGAGSRVDVWVVGEGRGRPSRARSVLEDIAVIAAPSGADSFTTSTARQVVLAVPTKEDDSLSILLAASGEGLVRLVGRR